MEARESARGRCNKPEALRVDGLSLVGSVDVWVGSRASGVLLNVSVSTCALAGRPPTLRVAASRSVGGRRRAMATGTSRQHLVSHIFCHTQRCRRPCYLR